MSQPDGPVPGLRPGREWHLVNDFRPRKYALYEPCVTSDGTPTFQWKATLTHSGFLDGWFVSAFLNDGVLWQVRLSESDEPPFEKAEVLYDAAS
jgi:hypothetical protein